MFVENELKKIENVDNINDARGAFLDILYDVVVETISDKTMFSIDDFSAQYYDEYVFETNCHKDVFSKIYLEIDQPLNYKMLSENVKKKKKFSFPELYITIDEYLDCLFETFLRHLDSNNLVWKDDHSINIKSTVNVENDQVSHFYFKIVPCITHFNSNNKHGVMYKKNGGIEIEFPQLSVENFMNKNILTSDAYRHTILIFKNILLKEKNITTLPSEIIEIMLYNVPNEMYLSGTDNKSLINIINYLRNNSIKNFLTLDEQDQAFTSSFRSLSLIYVKHVIKLIEKFLLNN